MKILMCDVMQKMMHLAGAFFLEIMAVHMVVSSMKLSAVFPE